MDRVQMNDSSAAAGAAKNDQKQVNLDVGALTRLFEVLVPPKVVVIHDLLGNEYRLPGAVPMRRQLDVLRSLQHIRTLAVQDDDAAAVIQTLQDGETDAETKMLGVVDKLLQVAQNPVVGLALSQAFESAYPQAVRIARQRVHEAAQGGLILDLEPDDDGKHAADMMFGVEEIVAALVPFFVRLAQRSAQALVEIVPKIEAMDE